MTFSGVKINGSSLGNPHPTAYDQADVSGKTEIRTGPITNGKSFTETYVRNS